MENDHKLHTFHIPVMGIGYTVDTPAKVAHLGISSVISLVDDFLIEKMREFYSTKFNIPYKEITEAIDDFRAKRITAFLDLMDSIVTKKFNELKEDALKKSAEFERFLEMLPDKSEIKSRLNEFAHENRFLEGINWLWDNMKPGNIDVNIMTKLDKENYRGRKRLPNEYNDAHAALRGFAKSKLKSSVVLSAGMHPGLYSYFEQFTDFYPDKNGVINKKIILKVSDYRSAAIQGKIFAKKGLWVSEYRVESGLNCGGHAFATQGHLLGPILEGFKKNRQNLLNEAFEIYRKALDTKGFQVPETPMGIKISAQGGVGTHMEHEFLMENYQVDSVGWGTPFLLVPEATSIDPDTLQLLSKADENDLYLSNTSPLGIPFNSVRNNTVDLEKEKKVARGNPGVSCSRRFGAVNYEYSEKSMCTSSKKYQRIKIEELKQKGLSAEDFKKAFNHIVDRACICVGLGTSSLLAKNLKVKPYGEKVSVCPGPNMAYFSKIASLKEMTDHIYGKINIIQKQDRPNMFIKELKLYVTYLKGIVSENQQVVNDKQAKYVSVFKENLEQGIEYYHSLFDQANSKYAELKANVMEELVQLKQELKQLTIR